MNQHYQQGPPPQWQAPNPQQPMQRDLPNATLILVFGILSIVLCTILGLIFGIISISMSGRAIREFDEHPGAFTPASLSNVKTGRTCAIIGVSLSALATVIMVLYFIFAVSFITAFHPHHHYY